jgi:glycosyltransferase involved in cell wall biosynthesis
MPSPSTELQTAVLVPAFDEATTVCKVVSDFLAADPSVTVYVYDNNSTDSTAQVAANAGAIVVREYRQGKGRVVRSMFRDIEADIYVMVDGDDTYPADEALALRQYVIDGSADLVIGDRLSSTYFRENKRRFHNFGNRLVRFLVNELFESDLRDIMSGCRCMSREFVKTMPVLSPGFEIETEMCIHALDKSFLVREVPVNYRDRQAGSVSKLSTLADGARVLNTVGRLFRDYRPMRFFVLVGLILLFISVGLAIYPVIEYLQTETVDRVPSLIAAAGIGTSAMLAFVCGVLLDSILAQARRAYEFDLTKFREQDSKRERCAPPVPTGFPADPRARFACTLDVGQRAAMAAETNTARVEA